MTDERELTDEHIALWREGCRVINAMTPREYNEGGPLRSRFLEINRDLTWHLVGPWSTSLFDEHLDDSPDEWSNPSTQNYRDWMIARTWRNALIEATGLTPRMQRLKGF
jgi:hypothetical protein